MTGLIGGLMQALVPAHLMAVLSTALLAAARTTLWPSVGFVAAFATGLAAGLTALASGAGETPAGDVLLAAALVTGVAAAAAFLVPRGVIGSIAFIVGLAFGLDSPPDAILLREAIVGLVGTWCAGVTLLVAAGAAATLLARLWNGIALRVVGSWIAATAMLVLALRWAS